MEILRWDELTSPEKDRMDELFAERIFPVLTPLAVDPSHPSPHLWPVDQPRGAGIGNPETGIRQFARVKVPTMLSASSRWPKAAMSRWRMWTFITLISRSAACKSWDTTPSGHLAMKTSRSRRTTPRICCSPWRRSCFVARSVARRFG